MGIKDRIERAEARSGDDDFLIAAFDPVLSEDGQELWRHANTKKVFTLDDLAEQQRQHPGWVIYCKKPYDPKDDPLICETDPDEWTPEETAAHMAKLQALEDEEIQHEYNVIRIRLSTGNSVEGFDERLIALAKESLGIA